MTFVISFNVTNVRKMVVNVGWQRSTSKADDQTFDRAGLLKYQSLFVYLKNKLLQKLHDLP